MVIGTDRGSSNITHLTYLTYLTSPYKLQLRAATSLQALYHGPRAERTRATELLGLGIAGHLSHRSAVSVELSTDGKAMLVGGSSWAVASLDLSGPGGEELEEWNPSVLVPPGLTLKMLSTVPVAIGSGPSTVQQSLD